MTRQPEFPHHEHIERSVQRACNFERDGNAAARQRQNDDILSFDMGKVPRQLDASMTTVAVRLRDVSMSSHYGFPCIGGGASAMPRWHLRCDQTRSPEYLEELAMLRNNRALLTGLGLGIGLMYFLDPERGRRRRARVRDKLAHTSRVSTNALGSAGVDLAHRATGLVARARGVLQRRPVDDTVPVSYTHLRAHETPEHL